MKLKLAPAKSQTNIAGKSICLGMNYLTINTVEGSYFLQ
jgi:hypothetical protein